MLLHSQLKIKYPSNPFIWDHNVMDDIYNHESSKTTKDNFLEDVTKIITSKETHDRNLKEELKIIYFMSEIADHDIYEDIEYVKSRQKIENRRSRIDLWINFQTTVYKEENGYFINSAFETDISWCLIPILGRMSIRDNKIKILDSKIFNNMNDINHAVQNKLTIARTLNPVTYTDMIDNKYDKFGAKIRSVRTSKRNFIKNNNIVEPSEKKDVFTNNENVINTDIIEPKLRKTQLTNKTRSSAQLIRNRLADPYKKMRFRHNPKILNQYKKVDTSLGSNISEYVCQKNNESVNSNEITVSNDEYTDFLHEHISIHDINGILKFSPITAGKITIYNDNIIHFVSIMRHKKKLYMTLHTIEFN